MQKQKFKKGLLKYSNRYHNSTWSVEYSIRFSRRIHHKLVETANNGTIRAAAAAYSSFQAAKLADVCKSQAGNELDVATNSFDVNCSAAGASANPICQAQCQAPGAENDPICQSILQNLAGANTAVNFSAGE